MNAVVRLVGRLVGTILAATFLAFLTLEFSIPGGFRTVVLPPGADASSPRTKLIIDAFHLDDNLIERYWHWLSAAVTGDFGISIRGGTPVVEVLTHRLPISVELALIGMILTLVIGVPLGLISAARSEHRSGRIMNTVLGFSQSIPVFLTPIFLIWLFSIKLRLLPSTGWVRISESLSGNLRNIILPAVALAFAEIGIVGRVIRADVSGVLREDYISAAMAKGLRTRYILFRHAFRPASLGLLNIIGTNIGSLLAGALVVEIIFGIGGLGQALLEASLNRDLYLVLGITTYIVVVYVLLSTLVDALLLVVDPRIRRSPKEVK